MRIFHIKRGFLTSFKEPADVSAWATFSHRNNRLSCEWQPLQAGPVCTSRSPRVLTTWPASLSDQPGL